jgi:hypothetical protein
MLTAADAVGVPLMVPVLVSRVSVAGSEPKVIAHLHVQGLPEEVAARVAEYVVPTSPSGNNVVVITGCAFAADAHNNASVIALHVNDKRVMRSPRIG